MASEFIGLTVLVTLNSPPDTQLKGLVAEVFGQFLTLHHVRFISTNLQLPEYRINVSQIFDLQVVAETGPPPHTEKQLPLNGQSQAEAKESQGGEMAELSTSASGNRPQSVENTQAFMDPAILSFERKPQAINRSLEGQPTLVRTVQTNSQTTANPKSTRASPSLLNGPPDTTGYRHTPTAEVTIKSEELDPSPSRTLHNSRGKTANIQKSQLPPESSYKGNNSRPYRKGSISQDLDKSEILGKKPRRNAKDRAQRDRAVADSGWRQTPMINGPDTPAKLQKRGTNTKTLDYDEALDSFAEEQKRVPGVLVGNVVHLAVNSSKRKGNRNRRVTHAEDGDGWNTEEATDIQERGEFDFVGNLSKFDKRAVFDEIKAGGLTAEKDRLVSINKIKPRPGTAGGKNLHHTENVLGPSSATLSSKKWNNVGEIRDSEEMSDSSIEIMGSGRSSRRNDSRTSARRLQSKKSLPILGASNDISARVSTSRNRSHQSSAHPGSPKVSKPTPPTSPQPRSTSSTKNLLRVLSSNRPCAVVSPLQMLDVERIAEVELGLADEVITENAGRGIAEATFMALQSSTYHKIPNISRSMVVILAGNNRSGARAIAAGRHLKNHGVRITICVLGLEREHQLLESVRRQLTTFRKVGGRLVKWADLQANLKELGEPPCLIIDGLFGMHVAFEDLRRDDQAAAYGLISWTNDNAADVMAIDIPSGIDASTGEVTVVDNIPLEVKAKFVVCMGAPKTGILNSLLARKENICWKLFVADLGISNTAWRKYGTRRRHGVEFSSEWVIELTYKLDQEALDERLIS
ncbi:MAG: enhancer of mRNA decapping [Trizodia sp. TS-e1964]|nr:MAG: enhancer of mRNA decapping [Trizodia sp. TS-e1964]